MNDDIELSANEKRALAELPREATPPSFHEECIVQVLRDEGVLGRRRSPGPWLRPWFLVPVSMAASLILISSGMFVGQWMEARRTERMLLALREQDNVLLAQRVQEAGSAYVRALAALATLREQPAPGARAGGAVSPVAVASEVQQGGEAAFGALYAAVLELARLAPDDPDVARIVQILEDRRFAPAGARGATGGVWY